MVRRRVMPIRGSNTVWFSCGNWIGAGSAVVLPGIEVGEVIHPGRSTESPRRGREKGLAIYSALTLPGGGVDVTFRCGITSFIVCGAHVMNIGTGEQKQMRADRLMPMPGGPQLVGRIFSDARQRFCGSASR